MLSLEPLLTLLLLAVTAQPDAPLQLRPLDLGALGPAAQPNVTVDARRGNFVLSWQARLADGCAALRVAELDQAGALGAIREVTSGCNWFVNWADFPALVVADNGDWLTYWLQKTGEGTYAYEIRTVRSRDRGRSWSAALVPHDDGTQTEHGFVSMAPAGADGVRLVWLDGRAMAGAAADSGHGGHAHGGTMSVRSALLDRRGVVPGSAALIDDNACSCCGTELLRLPGAAGHMALFRDRSEQEIRDIRSATLSHGRWQVGATVHDDGWKIAACPVNGPALAAGHGGTLAAWVTMPDADALAVRVRRLDHKPGFRTLEQGSAVLGRVDAAAFGSGWLVSWLGAGRARGDSRLQLGWLDARLRSQQEVTVAELGGGRNIGMPRLATHAHTGVLVWTETGAAATAGAPATPQLRAVRIRAAGQ